MCRRKGIFILAAIDTPSFHSFQETFAWSTSVTRHKQEKETLVDLAFFSSS